MKTTSRFLSAMTVCALEWLGRLPVRARTLLGDSLAFWGTLLPWRRPAVAARNLELCFPDDSPAHRRLLLRRHFREMGRGLLDLCWLSRVSPGELRRRVWVQGLQELQDDSGRGVILLAPHFRGMSIGGVRISLDHALAAMYQEQHNALVNRFMLRLHGRFEAKMFSHNASTLEVCRWLRQGKILYYLPDLDLGGKDRPTFVPFLGVPEVSTGTALRRIAALGRARVIPCVTQALDGGRYVVRLYPAWKDFPGSDARADARRMNRFIEDQVRQMPEQYYWLHRRFKTRPPGAPGLYENST